MHLLQGGIYIFQLADWYFASFALLVGSALEAIGICWCYGLYTRLPCFNCNNKQAEYHMKPVHEISNNVTF